MTDRFNIGDTVWIALGSPKLVKGTVVDIFDLCHYHQDWDPNRELYVIEIETGIDNIYEVRDFDLISPDERGPLMMYRKLSHDMKLADFYLRKVGINLPEFREDTFESTSQEATITPKPKSRRKKKYAPRSRSVK